jgi:hypothetical protein
MITLVSGLCPGTPDLAGSACLWALWQRQSRSALAFPGGAWEREGPFFPVRGHVPYPHDQKPGFRSQSASVAGALQKSMGVRDGEIRTQLLAALQSAWNSG